MKNLQNNYKVFPKYFSTVLRWNIQTPIRNSPNVDKYKTEKSQLTKHSLVSFFLSKAWKIPQ